MTSESIQRSNEVKEHVAVLSLGSNCGDRIYNVRKALDWIGSITEECNMSPIYETPEIHGIGNPYMNAVCKCKTDITLPTIIELTKRYELENGRDEECRKRGDVPIDIDVVVWDENTIRPQDYARSFFKIGYRMI